MQIEALQNQSELEAKAQNGDAAAQLRLGLMCDCGDVLPRDPAAAFEWFRKAAEQGLADAQFQVGVKYQRVSRRVPDGTVDEAGIEAYRWFKLAADQGHKQAGHLCDVCALKMSRGEVLEGNRRAAAFVPQAATAQKQGYLAA